MVFISCFGMMSMCVSIWCRVLCHTIGTQSFCDAGLWGIIADVCIPNTLPCRNTHLVVLISRASFVCKGFGCKTDKLVWTGTLCYFYCTACSLIEVNNLNNKGVINWSWEIEHTHINDNPVVWSSTLSHRCEKIKCEISGFVCPSDRALSLPCWFCALLCL